MNIHKIMRQLNNSDELSSLEVKRGSSIDKSVMETICAFSNEPDLGGGIIVLGIKESDDTLFSSYETVGVSDPDKLQKDIATQCASIFNLAVRPKINVEEVNGVNLLMVEVKELSPEQKPLYFKNLGLPRGAFRRIGSTDESCTKDDMFFFFGKEDNFDIAVIKDSDLTDINYEAVELYRKLRVAVNSTAEELNYNDTDLLRALNCIKKEDGTWRLTNTGLIVFGQKMSLRRLMPMVRVDYIRLPGKTWVENPNERFAETLDMRGPIIEMVSRTIATISDDLPKGFLLQDEKIQAESKALLPAGVLREAIVNAFIHRSYRINQPIQILRYSNRIEIINAGYSLKPEETIGEPGSVNRNPFIAAIFHDTNLAETKGTGFRTMQNLMKSSEMMPPSFESNREKNRFTLRLLFHNLLNSYDIKWLALFSDFELNDQQKLALVFMREAGAIDNSTYRQITGANSSQAGGDLRNLRRKNLFVQRNFGKSTYYLPGVAFTSDMVDKQDPMVDKQDSMVDKQDSMVDKAGTIVDKLITAEGDFPISIPVSIIQLLESIGKRTNKPINLEETILQLCQWKELSAGQLASILNRNEKHIKNNYLKPLIDAGKMEYTIPAMLKHPDQKYRTKVTGKQ